MTLESTSPASVKADARGTRQPARPRPEGESPRNDVMVREVPLPADDKYFDVPCTD